MAFLEITELRSTLKAEKIQLIASNDDLIVQEAINAAITDIKSRLTPPAKKEAFDGRLRYDVTALFNQIGGDRNPLILAYTKVAAIWYLIIRSNAGVDYEVIQDRYDRAVDHLKDLANGDASDLTIPILPTGTLPQTKQLFRSGSRRKFRHE